jgi:chaperonin GroES
VPFRREVYQSVAQRFAAFARQIDGYRRRRLYVKKFLSPLLNRISPRLGRFCPAAGFGPRAYDIAEPQGRTCMHFRPLHDRVLVRRIDAEEKTAGGIIIPDTAKEKPQEGEVITAGPGGRNEQGQLMPLDVKPGDLVLFGKWSGTEVKIEGQELLIMIESDLVGVVEKTGTVKKAA